MFVEIGFELNFVHFQESREMELKMQSHSFANYPKSFRSLLLSYLWNKGRTGGKFSYFLLINSFFLKTVYVEAFTWLLKT